MRGDAALTARLLLRGTGLAGMAVTVGGALAAIAATRPWYRATADLAMLGEQQGRTVATLPGVPSTVWGWLAVSLGLAAAVLGTAAALDRPYPRTRVWMFVCACALAAVALIGGLTRPGLERVAGEDGRDLLELAGRLPAGVDLELAVQPGSGPILLGIAAVLIALGASTARDL